MPQPIEPLLRADLTPDNGVLVVRGGPLTVAKIVEHAMRQRAVFTFRGEPMTAISVDLTLEGWSRYATSTFGALQAAGFELVATSKAPHYSVVLPDATDPYAAALLDLFGPTLVNEFKQRRR